MKSVFSKLEEIARCKVYPVFKEISSFEFLGLCTVILPSIVASVGFFFGRTVTPLYFYVVVVALLSCSLCVGWKRSLSYLSLILFCGILTAFTFSYVGTDAQNYHFPMQYLLRNGWNPVFDSTVEKFTAIAGHAQLSIYHTLFLPKFSSLCGAIVASAFRLFSGDGFLGYVLIVCLFTYAIKFARAYWSASVIWSVIFAAGVTFSTKITSFLAGQVDYSTYASFCIAMMALMLYIRDQKLRDLALCFVVLIVCMSSKSTGVLSCFVLIVMTLPMLYRRSLYWHMLFLCCIAVGIVGASPLITAWVQYGSPFYPSTTFNPNVQVVDITSDFSGNADALSMGYLSRICYAWVSPRLTVAMIRLFTGNSAFNPVFSVCGGCGGLGMWFNILLILSVILLLFSKKNLIAWLCVVLFVSGNFAPLKYIGYNRYFPQMWAIFPFAVLNFVYTGRLPFDGVWSKKCKAVIVGVLGVILLSLASLSLLRTLAYQGRMLVQERFRQDLISDLSQHGSIKVSGWSYRFTNVKRFEQAGVRLVKSDDGKVDTVMQPDSGLPCFDTRPEVYADLNERFPLCDSVKALLLEYRWLDVPKNLPHVLWK